MQSILLATPSKVSKQEVSNENKLSDGTTGIHDKEQVGKSATRFASVLENTVSEGKEIEAGSLEKNTKSKNKVLTDALSSKDESSEGGSKEKVLSLTKEQTSKISVSVKDVKALDKSEEAQSLSLGKEQTSKVSASIKEVKTQDKPEEVQSLSLGKEQTSKVSVSDKDVKAQQGIKEAGVLSFGNEQVSKVSASIKEVITPENELLLGETVSEDSLNEKNSSQLNASSLSAEETQNWNDELATESFASEINGKFSKEDPISPSLRNNEAAVKSHFDSSVISPVDSQNDLEALKSGTTSTVQNTTAFNEANADKVTSNIPVFSKKLSEDDASTRVELQATGNNSNNESFASNDIVLFGDNSEIDSSIVKGLPKDSDISNVNEVKADNTKQEIDALSISEDANKIEINESDRNEVPQVIRQQEDQLNTILNEKIFMGRNDSDAKSISSDSALSDETLDIDVVSTEAVIPNVSLVSDEIKSSIEMNLHKTSVSEQFDDELVSEDLSVESDLGMKDQQMNPILAQIQASQQTDTKVNESKVQVSSIDSNNVLKENKKGEKSSTKDNVKDFNKSDKANFENVLADTVEESSNLGKEMLNKANMSTNVASNEKIEAMLSDFRAEGTKPIFNQSTESHSLNALGVTTASADKLLHQSATSAVNSTLQSSALQQPLELQAKHASAMVGERIMMMLNQGKQEVTIRLDPAELGSMHIKLHVQQDQLQVAIQTQVGQSRDIIEQNLPRLREQLAQQGINLGEASVEQQSRQQQSNSQGSSQMGSSSQGGDRPGESFVDEQTGFFPTQIPLPAQGIDYYA